MGEFVGFVGTGAGVLTALMVAGVWAKGVYRQSSSSVWRQNYEAEKARGDRLEARVITLEKQVDVLSVLVTGAQAVEDLRDRMEHRFDSLEMTLKGR